MIAEYKLYHGSVLADLVKKASGPISIDEHSEEGRLSSYVLDGVVGIQVKHSTQRLYPWPFTFNKANLAELLALRQSYPSVYVVLVCHTDGMVCLPLEELLEILSIGESEQAWIKVDRRKGKWYSLTGAASALPRKKPKGIDQIVEVLSFRTGVPQGSALQASTGLSGFES